MLRRVLLGLGLRSGNIFWEGSIPAELDDNMDDKDIVKPEALRYVPMYTAGVKAEVNSDDGNVTWFAIPVGRGLIVVPQPIAVLLNISGISSKHARSSSGQH